MSNVEIVERLRVRGLQLTASKFKWILSNPFYGGYATGKLIGGMLTEGKQLALVSLPTFFKANEMLAEAPNVGIEKVHNRAELPLKVFMREETTGSPLTDYKIKGN